VAKRKHKQIVTIDAETDPFVNQRVPTPFLWGSFDGTEFRTFRTTEEMVQFWFTKDVYLFAHNGGKFDFMYLLPFISETRATIINGRIVEMKLGNATLRDSFAILPLPLRQYQKKDIEYWKLEKGVRDEHWAEIVEYLRIDCVSTHELVSAFFDSAGTRPTIASNALNFSRKRGVNPGRTHIRFDNHFRQFYFGGRVEVFKPGTHREVNVFDIKSSYPYAMSHDHPTGDQWETVDDLEGMTNEEIGRAFIEITCYSDGAFPIVGRDGGLQFPRGLGPYKVTGWEYLCARKHGLLRGERITAVHRLGDASCGQYPTINFTVYVDHWFHHKEHAKKDGDKAQEIVGKYMMNSLYGKLAQNPREYMDYQILPLGSPINVDEGWSLEYEFDNSEVHGRSVMWRHTDNTTGEIDPAAPLFHNVATGASITGFARAHLLDAICTVGRNKVAYCDTDSLTLLPGADDRRLRQDGKLGAWEWEGTGSPCHIAGKKQYGLTFVNGPKAGKDKIASKGARLTMKQMERLVNGETVVWCNDAPTFRLGKKMCENVCTRPDKCVCFIHREIRATARM
jgi:hypothetical protein